MSAVETIYNSLNVKGYFLHVQTYGLGANGDEISGEMDLILELLNVRTVCRYRYTYTQKKGTHSVRAKNADCTLYAVNEK